MKISIRNKLSLFLLILISSIAHSTTYTKGNVTPGSTSAEEAALDFDSLSEKEREAMVQEMVKILDLYLQKTLYGARAIDSLLEDVALQIKNNSIKVTDKTAFIAEIKKIRSLIDNTITNPNLISEANPHAIWLILNLNTALMEHLNGSVDAGFKKLRPFDITVLQKRAMPQDISFELIEELINQNQLLLEKLHEKATSVGLTWYNKLFRFTSDLNYKYGIGWRAIAYPTIATAGLGLLYYYNTHSSDQIPSTGDITNIPYSNQDYPWLRYILGTPPRETHGNTIVDHHGLIPLGYTEAMMRNAMRGSMPIGSMGFAAAAGLLYYDWELAKAGIQKAFNATTAYLQGGIIQEKAAKDFDGGPRYTFDDVVGLDYPKDQLKRILDYIENPERFALRGIKIEKGYLLTGPTRTGKSFIAEALAGEIKRTLERKGLNADDFSFYNIEAQFIMNKGIGYILNLAQNAAPCVIFIDEIDLLDLQRVGGNKQQLSEFLACLSGYVSNNTDPKKQVIIIAATNKPQNLDAALRQPGRFGKTIQFDYPTRDERKELLLRKFNTLAMETGKFDLEKLVHETENCSYEALNTMFDRAQMQAMILGSSLTQEALENSLESEINNVILHDKKQLPEHERTIIASHMAGQALAHLLLDCAQELSRVTIRPIATYVREQTVFDNLNKKDNELDSTVAQQSIKYGQLFTYSKADTLHMETREQLLSQCKVLLAGNAAQSLIMGSSSYKFKAEDRQKAFNIIKSLVFEGISSDDLSENMKNELLDRCYKLMQECEQQVKQLLSANHTALQAITKELHDKFTLNKAELLAITASQQN